MELLCTYGVDMGRHIIAEFVKQFEASIGELSRRRVLSRIVTEMVVIAVDYTLLPVETHV